MKESVYKNYDELPLFLNSATVSKMLGVSPSSAYELMHEPGFPVLKIGSRMVVPKEQFTAEAGYNLHLVSDYSQTFHLYGGLSALGGYETVNWGKHTLSDGSTLHNGDAFIYGGALTLSADFYLSDKIALTANIKERFVFGNSTGHFHTQYGIGVKFIIE